MIGVLHFIPGTSMVPGGSMSIFKPEYETYQDVKNTLAWWGIPVWFVVMALFWYFVLLPTHRQAVTNWPGIAAWVAKAGPVTALLVLAALTSQFMVHVLEVHDQIYDRFIVRWRDRYAREQMIPKLLKPYLEELHSGFLNKAVQNPRRTLDVLFYRFAADRDTKIGHNLIVRFYERITKYWLTQIVGVAVLLFGTSATVYMLICYEPMSRPRLLFVLGGCAIALCVNRVCVWLARKSVWCATKAEIAAIHSSCKDDFEQSLRELCQEYGFNCEKPSNQT